MKTNTIQTDISDQPIGIFDSGVGGLSILNRVVELMPNEKVVYVADTLHAPYGDKSDDNIIERVNTVADTLIALNCKVIVVACNTATVTAIEQLRQRVRIPIIGVEPAIKPAAQISQNKRIGILTTQATSTNQRFLSLVDKYKQDANVYIQPCPGLVEYIENHQLASDAFDELLHSYLANVAKQKVDTLVLGCTHYPFFADKIKSYLGSTITLMETARPVSKQIQRQLHHHQLSTTNTNKVSFNQHLFLSSKPTKDLEKLMCYFTKNTIKLQSLS